MVGVCTSEPSRLSLYSLEIENRCKLYDFHRLIFYLTFPFNLSSSRLKLL